MCVRVYRKATVPFETNHRLLAMTCSFPSKRKQKFFFSQTPRLAKPHKDMKSLKNDPKIYNNFSNKLDDINTFDNFFTESIIQASESEIPKIYKHQNKYPWTNDDFLSLLEKRRMCNDPSILRELGAAIKKLRIKLKNDYFSKLANNINVVSEARNIEEEFRLCKTYTMAKHSDVNLVSSEKLTDYFKDHLKERVIEMQPEVNNPEKYPHVLPPNDINVNSDIPTISEVWDAKKQFKDGKCQGTDKIYGEEVKYNNLRCFMMYLMLLLTTIWTTFILPS